jgi:hypothetical protein
MNAIFTHTSTILVWALGEGRLGRDLKHALEF